MGYGDVRCKHLTGSIVKADIKLFGDIPKKIKCKRVHFILNKYMYLQPIITQYFIGNKSEIWSLSLIVHSKG